MHGHLARLHRSSEGQHAGRTRPYTSHQHTPGHPRARSLFMAPWSTCNLGHTLRVASMACTSADVRLDCPRLAGRWLEVPALTRLTNERESASSAWCLLVTTHRKPRKSSKQHAMRQQFVNCMYAECSNRVDRATLHRAKRCNAHRLCTTGRHPFCGGQRCNMYLH